MEVLFNAKRYIVFVSSFLFSPPRFHDVSFSVILFGLILQTVEEKIARHSESGTVTERCLYSILNIIHIPSSSLYVFMMNLLAYYTLSCPSRK